MDQDQLNNLRNLAQAAHNLQANRIARETAAATSELLRAQEQQIALEQQRVAVEQQRVAVEQQRLQEEQRRIQLEKNEANEKKALGEKVKSLRVKMAALEEEIADFRTSLSKIDANAQLTGGGPVATYQFLLLQKRLEKLVAQKSDFHELSDIRFIGQLEKSVRELRQAFPDFCGGPPVEGGLQYLKDLAAWPSRSVINDGRDINPSHVVQEVRKVIKGFLETFEKAKTEIASSAVIARLLSEITEQEQLLRDAEAAFTEEWENVEPLIQNLQAAGIGAVEVHELAGSSFPHLVQQVDPIVRLQQGLRACRSGLDETEKCWARDNTAVQQARQYLAEGRLLEAQKALESLHGRRWVDIDSQAVEKEFENAQARELSRLIAETDKLAVNAPFDAVRQLESRAPGYAQLEKVFSGLLLKQKKLLSVLETRLLAEITQIETQDRKKAIEHGELLLKKVEGLPELQLALFKKITVQRALLAERESTVALRMLYVFVISGLCTGVAVAVPELQILENLLSADLFSRFKSAHVFPILSAFCAVVGLGLTACLTKLRKAKGNSQTLTRQIEKKYQLDLAIKLDSAKRSSSLGGNAKQCCIEKLSNETLSSIKTSIRDALNSNQSSSGLSLPGTSVDDPPVRAEREPNSSEPKTSVSVTVDAQVRPGAMVSGSASFSDGQSLPWSIDQFGRMGMVPPTPGYRPPAEDIPKFQMLLDKELTKMGL